MKFKTITAKEAPEAIGPYSQAIDCGDFVFCSGQIAITPETGKLIEGGISEQTEGVIKNLKAVLKESGCDLNSVVKTTVYLKNIEDFAEMNKVYAEYFTSKPARATVEVSNLPKDALVEIECVAMHQ